MKWNTQSQVWEFCCLYFFCDYRRPKMFTLTSEKFCIKCNYICEKTVKACRSLKNSRILYSHWKGSVLTFCSVLRIKYAGSRWYGEKVAGSLDHWPAVSFISSHRSTHLHIQAAFLGQGGRWTLLGQTTGHAFCAVAGLGPPWVRSRERGSYCFSHQSWRRSDAPFP